MTVMVLVAPSRAQDVEPLEIGAALPLGSWVPTAAWLVEMWSWFKPLRLEAGPGGVARRWAGRWAGASASGRPPLEPTCRSDRCNHTMDS